MKNFELFDELIQADPEKASALWAKIEFPSEPVHIPIRNDPNGPYNILENLNLNHQLCRYLEPYIMRYYDTLQVPLHCKK